MTEEITPFGTEEAAQAAGYPTAEETPVAPGEEIGGDPLTPETQEPAKHEPAVGSPRWKEVWTRAKAAEARLAELEAAQQFGFDQPAPVTPQVQTPQQADQDEDPMVMLRNMIREETQAAINPIVQQQQANTQIQQFEARHPDFDRTRDGPAVMQYVQKYGGNIAFEDAYRLAFPERAVAAPQMPPQQVPGQQPPPHQAPRAPLADVPSAPQGFEDEALKLNEMLRDFSLPKEQREAIVERLHEIHPSMRAAERAAGYQ